MISVDFHLAGTGLTADPSGALWWQDAATLIVADLHLEKGSSFARRGTLLPPYDTGATLTRLAEVIARRAPRQVIALGDSFHDAEAAARLAPHDAKRLHDLVVRQDWVWIAGNHDPAPDPSLGGMIIRESLELGPLLFRHEAVPGPVTAEISGHFHPKASLRVHGRRLTCRCFVSDAKRLILPAFGAYTGGLDIGDPAIAMLFPFGGTAYMLGRSRVSPFPFGRSAEAGVA